MINKIYKKNYIIKTQKNKIKYLFYKIKTIIKITKIYKNSQNFKLTNLNF